MPEREEREKRDITKEDEHKPRVIFGNGGRSPKFPGVVGHDFDPETGDFKRRSSRIKKKAFRYSLF